VGLVVLVLVIVAGAVVAAKLIIADRGEEEAVLGHEETISQIEASRKSIESSVEAEEELHVPTPALLASLGKAPESAPATASAAPRGVMPSDLGLRITGVSWHPVHPLVFLNGDVCRVGDVVAGATITAISQTSITVSDEHGRERTFNLYDE